MANSKLLVAGVLGCAIAGSIVYVKNQSSSDLSSGSQSVTSVNLSVEDTVKLAYKSSANDLLKAVVDLEKNNVKVNQYTPVFINVLNVSPADVVYASITAGADASAAVESALSGQNENVAPLVVAAAVKAISGLPVESKKVSSVISTRFNEVGADSDTALLSQGGGGSYSKYSFTIAQAQQAQALTKAQLDSISAAVKAGLKAAPKKSLEIARSASIANSKAASAIVKEVVAANPSLAQQVVATVLTAVKETETNQAVVSQISGQVVSSAIQGNEGDAAKITSSAILADPASARAIVEQALAVSPKGSSVDVLASSVAAAKSAGVDQKQVVAAATAAGVASTDVNKAIGQSTTVKATSDVVNASVAVNDAKTNQVIAQQTTVNQDTQTTQQALQPQVEPAVVIAQPLPQVGVSTQIQSPLQQPGAGPDNTLFQSITTTNPVTNTTTTVDPTANGTVNSRS